MTHRHTEPSDLKDAELLAICTTVEANTYGHGEPAILNLRPNIRSIEVRKGNTDRAYVYSFRDIVPDRGALANLVHLALPPEVNVRLHGENLGKGANPATELHDDKCQ